MSDESPVDQPSMEALFSVIVEIQESGKTYAQVLADAKVAVEDATRRLSMIEQLADVCRATKKRKPRKDRGVPRKKPAEATPAE